jgi:hypothetical protein
MFRIIKSDKTDIEIVIKDEKAIYQQFGYSSIIERDINKEFESYIISCIKNYSLDKALKLKICVFNNKENPDIDNLDKCIHKHFLLRAREMDLYLKQQFQQWVINSIIGVLFLVLCLILVQVLEAFSYINFIKIIKESLLIIGWVALWEPVTFILFNWRAMKRDRLYYKKMCSMPIIVLKY